MIFSFLYIISAIFLLTTFILYKKNEEKISFIKFATISIVAFLAYNTLICFLIRLINIPITLQLLSVCNICIGVIFLTLIIKEKKIQKFCINKQDILAILVIMIITLILAYLNFGTELHIKYIMTDSANHFSAAREFYEKSTLVDNIQNDMVSGTFMAGAYTNTGILFKIVEPFIGEINLYKAFIVFDISMLALIGISLYNAIRKIITSKIRYILTLFMILFYMLGYPLNAMIYGYVYLQVGILIIITTINLLQYYNEKLNKKTFYGILALLNFGLFFTYCIFSPILYIVEFIYIMKKRYNENKKIITIKNIIICFILFAIPIIMGICYFVLPHLQFAQSEGEVFVNIEGYIYRNCFANFIFILPISLFCLRKKDDNTNIWFIFTVLLIIFMLIFFIAIAKLNLSTYYYYKYNFILWFLIWYGAIYAINITNKKTSIILGTYITIYMVLAVIVTVNSKVEITKEIFDADENITNTFDIYGINKTIIKDVQIDYVPEEMKLLEYIHDNINVKENNILLIANPRQEFWFDGIFNYANRKNLESQIPISEVEKWNNKEYKYILVLYRSYYYEKYKEAINKGKLLFENSYGVIYVNE